MAKSRHQSNFLDVKIHPKKKVIGMVIPLPSMFWGGHQLSLAALGDGHLHQKKKLIGVVKSSQTILKMTIIP